MLIINEIEILDGYSAIFLDLLYLSHLEGGGVGGAIRFLA